MGDCQIDDVGDWSDGRVQPGDVHDGVADGIVVVDADVREIEKILAGRMADEMVFRHFVLPVGARDGDDFAALLLDLHGRVDGGGIDADVVENDDDVVLLDVVVFDDGRAEIDGALQFQILERLVEDGEGGLHERVDVGEAARAEEHFAHGKRRVAAAAIDADEAVVGDGVRHEACGLADVVALLIDDLADVGEGVVDVAEIVEFFHVGSLYGYRLVSSAMMVAIVEIVSGRFSKASSVSTCMSASGLS